MSHRNFLSSLIPTKTKPGSVPPFRQWRDVMFSPIEISVFLASFNRECECKPSLIHSVSFVKQVVFSFTFFPLFILQPKQPKVPEVQIQLFPFRYQVRPSLDRCLISADTVVEIITIDVETSDFREISMSITFEGTIDTRSILYIYRYYLRADRHLI